MITKENATHFLSRVLRKYWWDQILEFSNQYPDTTTLKVDYSILLCSRDLEELMESEPTKLLASASSAIQMIDLPTEKELKDVTLEIVGYPYKTSIRKIRHKHILKYISVEGIVRRVSGVKPKYTEIAYECMRCGHVTVVPQPQKKQVEPIECENETCGRKGPFRIDQIRSKYADFQVLEIQESPDSLRGSQPRNQLVHVYDELTDQVTAGDKVIIGGILTAVQKTTREGKSTLSDFVLEANHIDKLDKSYDELDISDQDIKDILELSKDPEVKKKIVSSIAPSIYGLDYEKEAMALQLFSGVAKNLPDGSRIRGDIHSLMIGDPGTAKSQLIKRTVDLSPRGVFNSGKSASGVGLTAAAVKDNLNDDRWTLEAGSLVMADHGMCAVDEMDKMREEDVSALHEALEQQVITVSKAGLHAELNSRCSMVGAANPVSGRFDIYDTNIAGQVNMKPSLLSRFDLIFIIRDIPNKENDARIASHISTNHIIGGQLENNLTADSQIDPPIPPELLRKYVAYARANIVPLILPEARQLIEQFYVNVRSAAATSKTIPLTARKIDGLYRLAEANAKTRLSEEVTAADAQEAINLVVECLKQVGVDPDTGFYNVDMIECGGSKSQRDRMKEFHEYAKDKPKFSFDEFRAHFGLDSEMATSYIQKMRNAGNLLQVEKNVYKAC